MKIVFLCGSLEPGRDGVGDYVRRLSAELIGHGHGVAALAINDRHISETFRNENDLYTNGLNTLRLPAVLDEKERLKVLKNYIEEFNPDWLSLQFVPFSFQSKGLVSGLGKKLKFIGGGRKWHVMFHELWVGMSAESSIKEKVWGGVQRFLIGRMLQTLKPSVINTHTGLYKKYIEGMGMAAEILPLFSNIPVLNAELIDEKIHKNTGAVTGKIVIFGGIHGGAPVKQLAEEAKLYGNQSGISPELVIIGRSGRETKNWVDEWKASGLSVTELGEQSEEKISEILAGATFGIFTTPIALVEKSGSVAAMRDHGVHLLCVSRSWTPMGIILDGNPFGIIEYKAGSLSRFFNEKPDFSYLPVLKEVTERFIANLLINK